MTKTNLIMEPYFSGDPTEWLNQIPESIIDQAIQILEIDPDKEMEPKGYSPVERDLSWWNTAKACFWGDLVQVIHRWGMPSPSQMQTSPAKLRKHATDIQHKLSEAADTIKSLEYPSLFAKGTMTKDFKFGYGLRQVSEVLRANKEGNIRQMVGPLVIKQEYESEGEWRKHYPFDHDMETALNALENMIGAINHLLGDQNYIVAERGKKKKGKDNYDLLVWGLCRLYKKYTGETPISSAREDGTATGKIIPFLQLALNQSSYTYEKTDWALEKKIRELRSHPTHGKLWQDAKN